jgi:hypothetical protein
MRPRANHTVRSRLLPYQTDRKRELYSLCRATTHMRLTLKSGSLMTNIKRGPQRPILKLSEAETQLLDRLYRIDGAWTIEEALTAFGQEKLEQLLRIEALGITPTEMGEMLLLLSRGRIMAYGVSSGAVSLDRQLNRAYFRLSLTELGWHTPQFSPKRFSRSSPSSRKPVVGLCYSRSFWTYRNPLHPPDPT